MERIMRGERFGKMIYESFRGIQITFNPASSEHINIISIKDISGGKINFHNLRQEHCTIPEVKNNQILKENDLIISLRGTSFKAAVFEAPQSHEDYHNPVTRCYLDENLACFRLNFYNSKLIAAYLNSPAGQQYLEQMSTGSRVKSLSMKSIENMRIPLPPHELQQELIRFLNASDKLLQKIEEEKQTAIQVSNSVIEKYMEGY